MNNQKTEDYEFEVGEYYEEIRSGVVVFCEKRLPNNIVTLNPPPDENGESGDPIYAHAENDRKHFRPSPADKELL